MDDKHLDRRQRRGGAATVTSIPTATAGKGWASASEIERAITAELPCLAAPAISLHVDKEGWQWRMNNLLPLCDAGMSERGSRSENLLLLFLNVGKYLLGLAGLSQETQNWGLYGGGSVGSLFPVHRGQFRLKAVNDKLGVGRCNYLTHSTLNNEHVG